MLRRSESQAVRSPDGTLRPSISKRRTMCRYCRAASLHRTVRPAGKSAAMRHKLIRMYAAVGDFLKWPRADYDGVNIGKLTPSAHARIRPRPNPEAKGARVRWPTQPPIRPKIAKNITITGIMTARKRAGGSQRLLLPPMMLEMRFAR